MPGRVVFVAAVANKKAEKGGLVGHRRGKAIELAREVQLVAVLPNVRGLQRERVQLLFRKHGVEIDLWAARIYEMEHKVIRINCVRSRTRNAP
ncbi:unnamed protein product [Phytomonas sp. Hart1]|nr:unnamed protein product [Phytomonas sp. Hart1]|eukprot:CCW67890.1 unnamed protein product [Phytomonas sp. isolate Hart1]